MKKLAISDFDGTMYPYGDETKRIPSINLSSIDKWRADGHLFAFCTGRNVLSMLLEIKRNNIAYDYLICNSGAIILDNQGDVLLEKIIEPKYLRELIAYLDFSPCVEVMVSTMDKMDVVIMQEDKSKLLKYFKDDNYKIFSLVDRYAKVEDCIQEGVTQFTIAMDDLVLTMEYVEQLKVKFAGKLQINHNLNYIDICAPGVNKVRGIKDLCQLLDLPKEMEIITIGDAHNDVEMLKEFKGYSLDDATEEAKAVAVEIMPNMGAVLLEELN